jgi:hypothetical protein
MTREDATIQALMGHIGALEDTIKRQYETIKALEQEPCEDAVSREAVLDYVYNDLGLGDEENGKDVERQMELERSYKYIKSLPPVTFARPNARMESEE